MLDADYLKEADRRVFTHVRGLFSELPIILTSRNPKSLQRGTLAKDPAARVVQRPHDAKLLAQLITEAARQGQPRRVAS